MKVSIISYTIPISQNRSPFVSRPKRNRDISLIFIRQRCGGGVFILNFGMQLQECKVSEGRILGLN